MLTLFKHMYYTLNILRLEMLLKIWFVLFEKVNDLHQSVPFIPLTNLIR